jgi:VanZ family protein
MLKWIVAVFWTAFIIYGLASPPSATPRFPWLAIEGVDKLVHVALFGVEAALCVWAVGKGLSARLLVVVIVWCTVLGGVMEVVQFYWVEGRSGDVMDLLADTFGATLGAALLGMFGKK